MFQMTNEVARLHSYQYQSRRAKSTIDMMASETGLIVEGTVLRALRAQGFELNPEVDNKSVYTPQKMFDALHKYAKPVDFRPNEDIWNQAYALTVKAFVTTESKVRQAKDVASIMSSVKGEKSSGAPEFSKKKDVAEKDYLRMLKWLNGDKKPDPCVAFHRVQHGSEGPKNRLVWGYPQSITMAESTFARPLIQHFLSSRCPMAIGKHRHKLSARMVSLNNCHAKYGLDFSGFDSSISGRLISMAFSILAKNVDWNNSSREDWDKIVNYFIHTPILMPDGHVYTKHRGVPSGSYFTQMVDSVVNYFAIQYATISLFGYAVHLDKLLVLGDDSLFSLPKAVSLKLYQEKLSELGLTVNVEKSVLSLDDEPVHFLGHVWKHGLVDRDPIDIAKRMAFPEKHSSEADGRERVKQRIYPYVADALSAHDIISGYSWFAGRPLQTYGRPGQMSDVLMTGWREYLSTVMEESSNTNEFVELAYVGILK